MSSIKNAFEDACKENNVHCATRCMKHADFRDSYVRVGFFIACIKGNLEIAELLLPYFDKIPIDALYKTVYEGLAYWNISRRHNYFLIIKLLFTLQLEGNIDTIYKIFDLQSEEIVKPIRDLCDEYKYRLDGPLYNENIL